MMRLIAANRDTQRLTDSDQVNHCSAELLIYLPYNANCTCGAGHRMSVTQRCSVADTRRYHLTRDAAKSAVQQHDVLIATSPVQRHDTNLST